MKYCLGCFENIEEGLEVCPSCGYIDRTPPEEAVHMEPGTILANRYTVGKVLGYGGFGVTYIGWDGKLEQKVAIKEYLPSEFSTRMPGKTSVTVFNGIKGEQFKDGLNKFVEEAIRLSEFRNEDGIVKIFDCIAENETAYIIMENLDGESLSQRLKRNKTIPEKEAIEILMPVMRSLEVIHKEGIIHRDISPDNIFLTKDGKVKLIDFGAARYATTSHSRSLTVIIKPGYSAEEQYRGRSDQGPHTDVYSLAATLYKMLTGVTPPDALERRAKVENAKKDILDEPRKINKDISQITENAILNALNIRIEDRTPTIREFINDLTSDEPVKRIHGKIKRIDSYSLPKWFRLVVIIALGGMLLFGILLASGVVFKSLFNRDTNVPEGYVIVPNTEGLSVDSAIVLLEENGLNYTTGGNTMVDYVDVDTIVYQNPEPGRIILNGSNIELIVSRGSGEVVLPSNGISTVPAYLWSDEETAIDDFSLAGLDPQVEYEFNEDITEGQVFLVTDISNNELSVGDSLVEGAVVVLHVATSESPISCSYNFINPRITTNGFAFDIAVTNNGESIDITRLHELTISFDISSVDIVSLSSDYIAFESNGNNAFVGTPIEGMLPAGETTIITISAVTDNTVHQFYIRDYHFDWY